MSEYLMPDDQQDEQSMIALVEFHVLRGECPRLTDATCRQFYDCSECWWYAITRGEEV